MLTFWKTGNVISAIANAKLQAALKELVQHAIPNTISKATNAWHAKINVRPARMVLLVILVSLANS